jgi:transposase InsO family protein
MRNTVQTAWILEQSKDYGVRRLCSVMSVSKSAYYAWTKAAETRKARCDKELKAVITAIFTQNRAVYGTRRLKEVLKKQGYTASRRPIGRIMQEAQLSCKTLLRHKRRRIPNTRCPSPPINLTASLTLTKPMLGDITYIHTQQGWLYLAVVIGLYSRQVMGWSIAYRPRQSIRLRQPSKTA